MLPGSVVVTGANGQVGRVTLAALVTRGVSVTALIRGHQSLAGCKTVGDWLASDAALAAIRGADALVHLAGTLNPQDHDYERANIVPTERLAKALVVTAILAALESEMSGTFDLQGPEDMTIDQLVRLLNGSDRVRITHVPGPVARLLRFVGPRLPGALIDTMRSDCRSEAPTAQRDFNLSLTSLTQVWGGIGPQPPVGDKPGAARP